MAELSPDVKALRYAGAMGHTYATVRTLSDGRIDCTLQASSLDSVKRLMSNGDRVYRRQRTGWRRLANVTPSADNKFYQQTSGCDPVSGLLVGPQLRPLAARTDIGR